MAYIPPNAKWYFAEVVKEASGGARIDSVLVRAYSPQEAFEAALELGGKSAGFRGLWDLNVIHDELEHGGELIFDEHIGMTELELQAWVRRREDLSVFRSALVSPDVKWYLADVVEELWIQDSENTVWTNTRFVRADSPGEAFDRATELGVQSNDRYKNSDGKTVTVIYRGLRELTAIPGELEHGAVLSSDLKSGATEAQIEKWNTPKEKLGVFAPDRSEEKYAEYLAKLDRSE